MLSVQGAQVHQVSINTALFQQQRQLMGMEGRVDRFHVEDVPTVVSVEPATTGCTELKWSDDHVSVFPNGWLRDNCHCSDCLHPDTLQRCFDPECLSNPSAMMVTQCSTIGDAVESISHSNDCADDAVHLLVESPDNDAHIVRLPLEWLRAQDFLTPQIPSSTRAVNGSGVKEAILSGRRLHWDPSILQKYSENLSKQRVFGVSSSTRAPASLKHVPHLSFKDLQMQLPPDADVDRTAWLRSVMRTFGLVFISGVPYDSNAVPDRLDTRGQNLKQWEVSVNDIVRAHFGYPRETIWGTIWDTTGDVNDDVEHEGDTTDDIGNSAASLDLGDTADVEGIPDTAYTTDALDPHTDCTYLRDPPELQVFLCTHQAELGCGGESTLIDGFRAAEELFRQAPHVYDFFCDTPLAFQSIHNGVNVQTIAPILQRQYGRSVVSAGKVASLAANLRSIRYNSYDRGPMSHLDSATIAAFYDYFPTLVRVMRSPGLMLQVRLGEGDMVIVDNHRVMHGRNSFHGSAERRLVGCYAEMTEIDTSLLSK